MSGCREGLAHNGLGLVGGMPKSAWAGGVGGEREGEKKGERERERKGEVREREKGRETERMSWG